MTQQQIAVFVDFENLGIWADRQFYDRSWVSAVMRFLSTRGRVVIKRAYADWNNFNHYRKELLDNSVEPIQLFQVNAGKNRADIRLVIDALETALTNERIETFVIVSGDSDFGPLMARLREHGRTTLGIGPADTSHPLLRRSCDEFIFLETVLGQAPETSPGEVPEVEQRPAFTATAVRSLLRDALEHLARQGALPVSLDRLRGAMQRIEPAFNESSLGTASFIEQLRANSDLAVLLERSGETMVDRAGAVTAQPRSLEEQYGEVLAGIGLRGATPAARELVIADLYLELVREGRTANIPLDDLERRYREAEQPELLAILRPLWGVAVQRQAARLANKRRGPDSYYGVASGLDDVAFRRRIDAGLLDAFAQAGLPIDPPAAANVLFGDPGRTDEVAALQAVQLPATASGDAPAPQVPELEQLAAEETLRALWADLKGITAETADHPLARARDLVDRARQYRASDFSRAAQDQLHACKLYLDALRAGFPGATTTTLRYYLATYASLAAGDQATNKGRYEEARAYYRAFFFLLGEQDGLTWKQLRALVSPMLQYYFYNVVKELGLIDELRRLNPGWDFRDSSFADVAVRVATVSQVQRFKLFWQAVCADLASANPGLLRQVAAQIRLEQPMYAGVAAEMERLLPQEV